MDLILLFIILSAINVVLSTIRSLVTIKCNKWVASIINATYYAFYTIVVIYTVADFSLWIKVLIVFICNLIGVFVVKLVEEKMRKDKLWKIEMTIHTCDVAQLDQYLTLKHIPHSYIEISPKHSVFNCYCATQMDSKIVTTLGQSYNAKFFATESERLLN